jgi:hypothetical protein
MRPLFRLGDSFMMRFIPSLILLLMCVVVASAQSKATVTLMGTAMDSIGSLIPDAKIKARSISGKTFETRSVLDGTYRLELTPDVYTLNFSKHGYENLVIERYQIAEHQKHMTLDFSLICIDCEPLSVFSEPLKTVLHTDL